MGSVKAFIFGVVTYYIFTGIFGMSFLGSFILTLTCTFIIDTVIAFNKSDDKEKNDHDKNNGTQS